MVACMSITDIGRESAEESSGQAETGEDYERFDVTGMDYLKNHPTTGPAGTARTLRYFPGDPDEDNLDRGYTGLVVDDPYIVNDDELTANVIVENDKSKGDDFKVVDLSDDATQILTASGPVDFFDEDTEIDSFEDAMGIDFSSNNMYGDVRAFIDTDDADEMIAEASDADDEATLDDLDSVSPVQAATLRADDIGVEELADTDAEDIESGFNTDSVIIKLTGNSGRGTAQCLDVHGAGGADVIRTDNGEPEINEDSGYPEYNGALIEYTNVEDEGDYTPPRFARDTQLRPDIEGEEVAFLLQRQSDVQEDYDGDSYWSTVLTKGETGEWEKVVPTDEFEPDQSMVQATRWVEGYPSNKEILEARRSQGVTVDDDLESKVEDEEEAAPEAE